MLVCCVGLSAQTPPAPAAMPAPAASGPITPPAPVTPPAAITPPAPVTPPVPVTPPTAPEAIEAPVAPIPIPPMTTPWEDKIRATMMTSIDKQRASVQKQASSAASIPAAPADSFFILDWPALPVLNPVQSACDPMPADKLNPLVEKAAAKEGVKPDLVKAVIGQESGARPCAVSMKGAQGLMQLMPSVARQFGVSDPFDPQQNIDAGTKLLKELLSKYKGDVPLALSAYNAGANRVDRDGGVPAIPETINYVSDILAKLSPIALGN
jgi:soluble lytic murein transglycosylase-like protein